MAVADDKFETVRRKLKIKNINSSKEFKKKYPKAYSFLTKRGVDIGKIRKHSAEIISLGALTGSLMLSSPSGFFLLPDSDLLAQELKIYPQKGEIKNEEVEKKQESLAKILNLLLPKSVRPLTISEEKFLEKFLSQVLGIPVKASLSGEHLNTTYGYIGLEQHLRRFPGDSLALHGEGEILKAGMAGGLGAWGYFAASAKDLTYELENIERWYVAVQTLYLPDWDKRQAFLKDWYKYRKVLLLNLENGKALVAAIADSGPAAWTGKQFGGSPEVMNYLGGEKFTKGRVLLFFVDDPEKKVELGPISPK